MVLKISQKKDLEQILFPNIISCTYKLKPTLKKKKLSIAIPVFFSPKIYFKISTHTSERHWARVYPPYQLHEYIISVQTCPVRLQALDNWEDN